MNQSSLKSQLRGLMPVQVAELGWLLVRAADPYVNFSYSQEGEDMILARLFGRTTRGFYVDVGAHHPYRFSNTCLLHRQGWQGVNIDADEDAIKAFRRHRPRDVNLALGVSEYAGQQTFYRFSDPALNTIDPELARQRSAMPQYRLLEQKQIKVERLETLLKRHVPRVQSIDLLNVDVEGHDLEVLRSNDWSLFQPRCIVVEARAKALGELATDPVYGLLAERGYWLFAKTVNTLIFLHGDAS